VVAIDGKRIGDQWEVFIDGGRVPTGLVIIGLSVIGLFGMLISLLSRR
jgi:hypothetical protein